MNFRSLAPFVVLLIFNTVVFSATLPATEDSYGYRAKLTTAANKAVMLPVDSTHRAFIFFDLANNIPTGTQIRYARLRLYLPKVTRAGGGLGIHQVMDSWDESLASAEPTIANTPLASLPSTGLGSKRFISVDVTNIVQSWITSPASNEGLAITAIPGATTKLTASVLVGSKEGAGSGYPAELDIEIATDPVAAGAIGTAQLSAGAVQSANIANGAVGVSALADGSVTTIKIASGAVQSANIASGAVGVSALADGSVTTAKIANSAVTDEKITTVSGAKVSGTVPSAAVADSATNSIAVNGISASASPTPNTLLPLDASGKLPASVLSLGAGSVLALSSADTVPAGYVDTGSRIANWKVKIAENGGPQTGVPLEIGGRLFFASGGGVQEFNLVTNNWTIPLVQVAPLGSVAAVGANGRYYFF